MKSLKALGVMLALFVLCYIPAFGVARVLRLSMESAVPMIIGVSLLMAVISRLYPGQQLQPPSSVSRSFSLQHSSVHWLTLTGFSPGGGKKNVGA